MTGKVNLLSRGVEIILSIELAVRYSSKGRNTRVPFIAQKYIILPLLSARLYRRPLSWLLLLID